VDAADYLHGATRLRDFEVGEPLIPSTRAIHSQRIGASANHHHASSRRDEIPAMAAEDNEAPARPDQASGESAGLIGG
jgi:hypothetical protein